MSVKGLFIAATVIGLAIVVSGTATFPAVCWGVFALVVLIAII